MFTANIFVIGSSLMPIRAEAIIICPVEDTGKNSVSPSTMANIIACHSLIYLILCVFVCFIFHHNGKQLNNKACQYDQRPQGNPHKAQTILLVVERHDDKTNSQHGNAYQHQDVVFSAEGKFISI